MGGANVLKQMVVMIAQHCKYTKKSLNCTLTANSILYDFCLKKKKTEKEKRIMIPPSTWISK